MLTAAGTVPKVVVFTNKDGVNTLRAAPPTSPLALWPEQVTDCLGASCCTHGECASLKKRALCARWYFVRWVPASTAVMPSYVVRELRNLLDKRKFRHYGVVTGSGVCEVLVRLDRNVFTTWAEDLVPDGRRTSCSFKGKECRAWHLECCWDALENDVDFWLRSLEETFDRIPFGDKRLLCDLVDDVKAVGTRGGEVH